MPTTAQSAYGPPSGGRSLVEHIQPHSFIALRQWRGIWGDVTLVPPSFLETLEQHLRNFDRASDLAR
eukprot:5216578-Prymnesium_polylepis.1